jgi:hypothetical protein
MLKNHFSVALLDSISAEAFLLFNFQNESESILNDRIATSSACGNNAGGAATNQK